MVQDRTWGNRLFDIMNITILGLIAMITVIPFIHVVAGSFATEKELLENDFLLFPTEFSLNAYRYVFSTDSLVHSLFVSIYITVVGTALHVFMTSLMGYALSRRDIIGRKPLMLMVIFTLLFSGGMIPQYLVVREFGLLDSLWSLMIPNAISAFYLIILKNFFQQLPPSLEESAKIDGCHDLAILFRIVIPLSLPAIATITLFYAVMQWNIFLQAILYINDAGKWPIQVFLRSIVLLSEGSVGNVDEMDPEAAIPEKAVKLAVITVATVPILIFYPFLQKHFAKGVLLGSVKG